MSAKNLFISLLTLSLLLVVGMTYFTITLFLQGDSLVGTLLMVTLVVLIWRLTIFLKKHYCDLKLGMPIGDERTRKVRMYSAGYAYFMSLYIWLTILMFHKYLEYDDALILGLLGMALSLGLSWFLINRSKGIE